MTSTVITPFTRASAAIELGNRLWRKKLLPVGDVAYKGRMLHFTRDYIERLAEAFHSRAYGQVPFQLAGDDNKHTNDVERFAGEIIDAEAGPDGLWVTLKATPRGEKVLTENPSLGVSARIVEDYERSDGRFFSAAVQHPRPENPRAWPLAGDRGVQLGSPGHRPLGVLVRGRGDGPAGGPGRHPGRG